MVSFLLGLLTGLLIFGVPVYSEKESDPGEESVPCTSPIVPSKEL